jgi:hypothetical protein
MITFKSPFKTDEKIQLMELFQKINLAQYKKLDNTVCPELKYLVENMLVADPTKRIGLEEVIIKINNIFYLDYSNLR